MARTCRRGTKRRVPRRASILPLGLAPPPNQVAGPGDADRWHADDVTADAAELGLADVAASLEQCKAVTLHPNPHHCTAQMMAPRKQARSERKKGRAKLEREESGELKR